jgi:peptidyl-prolyl cis-trans isomerase C
MVTLLVDHAAAASEHRHECGHSQADASPSKEPVPMPEVTVNGVVISRKAIAAEVQNVPARNPGEGWRAATRALVIRELLLQEAGRLAVPIEPQADADGRVETDEDATVRALVEREVRVPEADEATLRRFYDNNRHRFTTPPLFEADHILVAARRGDAPAFAAAREKIEALAGLLAAAPERFAELAREHSDCPSAALGGSLGQISPGETTPEFETALADLAPGAISAPVETRYGVHLIRLNRRIAGRQMPFEAARGRIASYLADHVRHTATAQYLSLLIGRADIRGIAMNGATSPLVQ